MTQKDFLDALDMSLCPTASKTYSYKETLVNRYVTNFIHQFKALHPHRTQILWMLPNECHLDKFVCTTLQPSLPCQSECNEFASCARYIAETIQYEPLTSPIPTHLVSPFTTLTWQCGGPLDMATLLCSILLGAGYDAYVVCGQAPLYICQRVRTGEMCPYHHPTWPKRLPPTPEPPKVGRTRIQSHYPQFPLDLPANTMDTTSQEMEVDKVDESDPEDTESPQIGFHAWVLLRPGKRGIECNQFLEPTTGCVYSSENAPYICVESVWNAANHWIHMTPERPMKDMTFDLQSEDAWEFMFADPQTTEVSGVGGMEGGNQLMDLPPSWSPRVSISPDLYAIRYPNGGNRSEQFQDASVTLYAPYVHESGLIQRVERGPSWYETFAHRSDGLKNHMTFESTSDRLDFNEMVHCLQLRPHNPQSSPESLSVNLYDLTVDHGTHWSMEWKDIGSLTVYYENARKDGLIKRIILEKIRTLHWFTGREDLIRFERIRYDPDQSINKITIKYEKNSKFPFHGNVAAITFYFDSQLIRVRYYTPETSITCPTRYFYPHKPSTLQYPTQAPLSQLENAESTRLDLFTRLSQLSIPCHDEMFLSETHALLIEYGESLLSSERIDSIVPSAMTLCLTIDEKARIGDIQVEEEDSSGDTDTAHSGDFLTAYLPMDMVLKPQSRQLSQDEAIAVRTKCLKALKDRLIMREKIMQMRMANEKESLAQRKKQYQMDQDLLTADEEEAFAQYHSEAIFRIQILESRIQRHESLALQQYQALDDKLRHDKRLAIALT